MVKYDNVVTTPTDENLCGITLETSANYIIFGQIHNSEFRKYLYIHPFWYISFNIRVIHTCI